jgi:predicted GNAT family acetyltransferase
MTDQAVQVTDNAEHNRYEARIGDRVVAFSTYRILDGRVVFLHTETDEAFGGRGIAGALVRGALDEVRARGLRVTAKCPYVRAWIERHPDYADLLASTSSTSAP